jgi:hypothetical protein
MRSIIAGAVVTTVLLSAGCDPFKMVRNDDTSQQQRKPPAFGKAPDAVQLVNYLNDNADRILGINAEVVMDCRQGKTKVGIDGNLACSGARNFRLKGFAVGSPEVDIGSNDTEFWYWVKRADPPYVFHCSYAEFPRVGPRLPFPFQPDMIATALGVAKYDPAKNYRIKQSSNYLELIEDAVAPDGQAVDKVTVFNRMEARRNEPQVAGHILRNKQGRPICYATVKRVTYDMSAVIPQDVVLVWPDKGMEMEIQLQHVKVTRFDDRQAQGLFTRRDLVGRLQSFDLARGALDTQVQPAGLR